MALETGFSATGFNVQTAYYLAKVSAAAYQVDLSPLTVELGLPAATTLSRFGEEDEFAAFVADLGGPLVLAFRGSDNIQNWLTNSRVAQVSDKSYPGRVHSGFAEALEVMWPGLLKQMPAGSTVWVTGHSLGGALATLAGARLLVDGFKVAGVYTFGSPRVGDLDFYRDYEPVNYRVVNNDDIVPHVPLEILLLGVPPFGLRHFMYKHVGTLQYLDRHGTFGEGMSGWEAKKEFILNGLLRSGGTPWPGAIEDHLIVNYIAAIFTNLPTTA